MKHESVMTDLKSYHVWDVPTLCFHWINVLCVLTLAGFGLVILNAGALEISNTGKILLKTLHVWVGYVFALNIAVRLVWGFVGNHHARWRQMYDKASYADMRSLREPFALVHLYGFYLLAIGIVIHISGVVMTELRERNGSGNFLV